MTRLDDYLSPFPGDPLDSSRLAKAIADSVPGANQKVEMDAWRADLKRRVRNRLAAIEDTPPTGDN